MNVRPGLFPAPLATFIFVFLTGMSAMMDEVVWQRYLARLLGADAAATAVVLAVFLGGLSLGYWAFGRVARRIARPLRVYAFAEAFIGVWGLMFPWLFSFVEAAATDFNLEPPLGLALQGFGLAAVLMGPPTICMGATIPLLTQALSSDLESSGPVHASLYGINTAGAFLGAVAAGYLTVPELGLPGSLKLAASLNLMASCWFAFAPVCSPAQTTVPPPLPSQQAIPVSPHLAKALLGLAMLNGFQAMGLENVLVRFVALSFGGSAYSFTMVVGVFVLSIAAGALLAGKYTRWDIRAMWSNQLLIAALLLLIHPTLDTWPYWAHRLRLLFAPTPAGFWGFQAAGFAALALIAGLPAMLIGAAVPLIFNRLRSDLATVGRLSGRILCANTLGNLSGSLVAGLLLHPYLNNGQIFLLCAVLALFGAWFAAAELSRLTRWATALAALAGIALIPANPAFDPERFMVGTFRVQVPLPYSELPPQQFYREFQDGAEALFLEDGPEGSAAVARTPRQAWHSEAPLAILVNGKSDSSTVADMATLRLLAHLPALLSPSRTETLVIGLGTGVTSGELALYPDVASIDTAEISSSVIKALPLFGVFTGAVHQDARFNVIQGDAFRILARSHKHWNLIVSEPSNPWVLGVDALFSREFYRLARRHLAEDGLFVQWIHIHDASEAVLGIVLRTLRSEFPHIRLFMSQANDLIVLASIQDFAASHLDGAARTLAANPLVAGSLEQIGLHSIESLLAREITPPSLPGVVQTLDKPLLHYLAGKSYFMGDRVSQRLLLSGEGDDASTRSLLEQRVRHRSEGPLGRREAEAIRNSAMDRRGEEAVPLPLHEGLGNKLNRLAQ
ncbi:MAG: fused MFS/spermidine synthase [Desulfovibrio sp.]|nr:fused MFS/spermidine synthase [Desulfovibrio sp.]MBI4958973.1 fused MFS/spermidine synthase [Desulfovibrio sp.]